jgi:hypothetical protein
MPGRLMMHGRLSGIESGTGTSEYHLRCLSDHEDGNHFPALSIQSGERILEMRTKILVVTGLPMRPFHVQMNVLHTSVPRGGGIRSMFPLRGDNGRHILITLLGNRNVGLTETRDDELVSIMTLIRDFAHYNRRAKKARPYGRALYDFPRS